jgi:hypothetical protein
MVSGTRESGLDQEGAELVSVQAKDARLMAQPRASDVGCRVVGEEFFFDAVPVETGDCGEASGDRGTCRIVMFEPAGEQFDMGPTHIEQLDLLAVTPTDIEAEILLIRQPGVPRIARQEPTERQLHLKVTVVTTHHQRGCGLGTHLVPPDSRQEAPTCTPSTQPAG